MVLKEAESYIYDQKIKKAPKPNSVDAYTWLNDKFRIDTSKLGGWELPELRLYQHLIRLIDLIWYNDKYSISMPNRDPDFG